MDRCRMRGKIEASKRDRIGGSTGGRVVWNRRRLGTRAGSVVLVGQVGLTIGWKIEGGLEVVDQGLEVDRGLEKIDH
jgi:hypothetical protein